jgi:hypothetical protein
VVLQSLRKDKVDSGFMVNRLNNFVGEQYIKEINSIIFGNNFPWFFLNNATPSDETPKFKDINGNEFINSTIFRHWFYIDDNINSNMFDLVKPVCYKIAEYFGKDIILKTVNMNLTPSNDKLLGRYGIPHIDKNYSLEEYKKYDTYTGLYYLNDTDGDTILYNELYNDSIPSNVTHYMNITPKADTLLLWNSRRYHSAPAGCSMTRAVLNINFLVEK